MKKNEQTLREMWDTIKCISIQVMEIPEGEERKEQKRIFEEIIAENFANLMKNINIQI